MQQGDHAGGPAAPIFIVGLPRSGTTLLASMVNAHPRIDCGPETRFFSRLKDEDLAGFLDASKWPGPATDFVCGLRLRDAVVHQLFGVDRETVGAYLAARPPSVAALLESLTATRAAAHGKPRWAEKTPRHLMSLDRIRQAWPDAVVVRLVRDPRDVALSAAEVPFGSPSVVANLMVGLAADRGSRSFFDADARSCTLRYEDLVADPEGQLRTLCDVLGERFEPAMLERQGADDLLAQHEWWKRKATDPLDLSRVGRWRREMDPATRRFAALFCREQLEAHGYEGARRPGRLIAVVPIGDRVPPRFRGVLLSMAAADAAITLPAPRTVGRLARERDLVFWGSPRQMGVELGGSSLRQALGAVRLAASLLARRVRRQPALWVHRHTGWPERRDDRGEIALDMLLRVLARRAEPEALPALLRLPTVEADAAGAPVRASAFDDETAE